MTKKTKHGHKCRHQDEARARPSAGVADQPDNERGQLGSADLGGVLWDTARKHPAQAFHTPAPHPSKAQKTWGSRRAKRTAAQTWAPWGRAEPVLVMQ